MGQPSLVRQAFEMGRVARECMQVRVSPFYEERVLMKGRRIDITPMLDAFFFAGYDGEPYPDISDKKPDALDTATNPLPTQQSFAADC